MPKWLHCLAAKIISGLVLLWVTTSYENAHVPGCPAPCYVFLASLVQRLAFEHQTRNGVALPTPPQGRAARGADLP